MTTIFYSWQSDLPNSTNRGFIKDALQKAIKELNKAPVFVDAPRELDVDTAGVPGSPDIADTILDKINKAEVCVFDVSIIGLASGRPCPNPNVLIELGYAVQALSWARIILVFNRAHGQPEDLPFDIRSRRIVDYHATEGADGSAEERKTLAGKLRGRLDESYRHLNKHRFSDDEKRFFVSLYSFVRGFLDSAEEYDDRCLKPWVDLLRDEWAQRAKELRKAASTDASTKWPDVASSARSIAGSLDGLVNFERSHCDGHEFKAKLHEVEAAATSLLTACTEPIRGEFEEKDYRKRKRELSRRALDELDRLEVALEKLDSPVIVSARDAMTDIGSNLLSLAADLEIAGDPDAGIVRPAAHALHVAQIKRSNARGFRDPTELLARLTPLVQPLARFTTPS